MTVESNTDRHLFIFHFLIFFFLLSSIFFYSLTTQAIVYEDEYHEQFIFSDFQVQSQTYVVQYGDSLYAIAQHFGVTIADIRRENNIWHDNLYPGQQLQIPATANRVIYRVQWGDSLFRIAHRFGTTVAEIREVNNLYSNNLLPGQELIIPGTETEADSGSSHHYTIVVDAGHGGHDPGAVTYYNSRLVKESDLVLDIANRLVSLLNEAGYQAVSTRTGDYYVPLWRRVQIAHQHNTDLFVSIHVDNSPPNPATRGSNVYIAPGASWNTYQLAENVQLNLEQTTGRPPNHLGRILREPFTVVMQSTRPAILVEAGFLSNWSDLTRLQTPQFRYQLARGIFKGIEQWLN